MKTHKNLYKKLCSWENIVLAYKKARKGKTKKPCVLKFEENLHKNLKQLQNELLNKTYQPEPLKKSLIKDPKTRVIHKSIFKDRIVHHIIVNILEPIFEPIFIYDSYASRKGKGQHRAIKRFNQFKRKASKNGKKLKGIKDKNYVSGYALKIDIKHYFENIDHDILLNIIQEKVDDKDIISLIYKILKNYRQKGMPLGNYTSQFFANVYLNKLDYFSKYKLKTENYIRYVDDIIILHNNKRVIEWFNAEISKYLTILKLEIHKDKSRIISLHKGIPFLGFRIFYHYNLLNKKKIKQIYGNLKNWEDSYASMKITKEQILMKLRGWVAHTQHSHTHNLTASLNEEISKIFPKEDTSITTIFKIQAPHSIL
ncbi:MAG: reverse transcriptase domain-containing protein [Nanoarchaeota archaeon]